LQLLQDKCIEVSRRSELAEVTGGKNIPDEAELDGC